ncbi:MAG: sensor domain-containing diguanylate cyclase [Candidatus Hydrogenedentes bacterium]|nr:sensor domain-containing diguanylate cyclase [Candidatus Hydrogenedentota bacterium]
MPETTNIVPITEPQVYSHMVAEVARLVIAAGHEDTVLLVERETLRHLDARHEDLLEACRHLFIFGTPPTTFSRSDKVTVCSNNKGEEFFFMVALSPHFSILLSGRIDQTSNRGAGFVGGWTGQREQTIEQAKKYLNGCGELPNELLAPSQVPDSQQQEFLMQVMAFQAGYLGSLNQSAAKEKHDLTTVLEILKAISSRRRSHDVLFVFVEQIARVIGLERCSVVRIWGSSGTGHVLASHDDESISDLTIAVDKYPELGRALQEESKVVINDAQRDSLVQPYADVLKKAGVQGILVIPIVMNDPDIGSLFLRAVRAHQGFSAQEVSFCEIVAEAASNALERSHLFENIQRANERLERLAITDGLTGLYNHRHFRERLEDEFFRARRYHLPMSCLILDVDNFKTINDNYGHLSGDKVLREIAERIQRAVRKSDFVARYGGEEFVVLMPQTAMKGAVTEASRLLKELRKLPYPGLPETEAVTVSIGVAVLDHENMLDCEALIRAADGALYEAKRQGKDRYCVNPVGETM